MALQLGGDCQLIANAITVNNGSLTSLDISSKRFSAEGAKVVAEALKVTQLHNVIVSLLGISFTHALYEQVVEALSDLTFSGDADQSITIQASMLTADLHGKDFGVCGAIVVSGFLSTCM
jgi:hypothetical protein